MQLRIWGCHLLWSKRHHSFEIPPSETPMRSSVSLGRSPSACLHASRCTPCFQPPQARRTEANVDNSAKIRRSPSSHPLRKTSQCPTSRNRLSPLERPESQSPTSPY